LLMWTWIMVLCSGWWLTMKGSESTPHVDVPRCDAQSTDKQHGVGARPVSA
jgi:hypothetical protein